ncbi:unnamed protein product [Candidula unifasciata]|uniref:Uncharacterized protein n=1 Tax=Candidula unifasciata TaxID=100452 RepID=A0A8S3ZQV8_9EUPU|nr:unnamed protein product [Candidula unifasciata]
MKGALMIMAGIGFTVGVIFGLLLQLPIDNTLPADDLDYQQHHLADVSSFRSRRSLSETDDRDQQLGAKSPVSVLLEKLTFSKSVTQESENQNASIVKLKRHISPEKHTSMMNVNIRRANAINIRATENAVNKINVLKNEGKTSTKYVRDGKVSSTDLVNASFHSSKNVDEFKNYTLVNGSKSPHVVSVTFNLHKSNNSSSSETGSLKITDSHDNPSLISDIVNGILWSSRLEQSCPRPFQLNEAEAWRRQVEELDVVKMEEGCGRMQNRLITFRDSTKACARYRLNTDQIQGEIFSYYLARIFNVSNIPPTILDRVDTLSSRWKTVHLQLSLAQWADSKLVVLTQHIGGLSPAHIPEEFREEGRRLEPTAAILASKSDSELCELVQWSDLIVFDYLTANLDRVINNMFNRQWNDQMMNSPAHNLEQQADGSLVFLDNESGLFHGYRLLEKYSTFHESLLESLCVFRPSTVETIRRLHKSASVGEELHRLFTSNEVLHKHLAVIPNKNLKILQQRIEDVYKQIVRCELLFGR